MIDFAIDNDWSPEERRQYERHQVEFYMRVVERDSGTLVGHVVDISKTGMKLIGNRFIPVNRPLSVQLEVTIGTVYQNTIVFEAQCVWCRHDLQSRDYEAGFENALSDDGAIAMHELIDLLVSLEHA